MMNFKNHKHDGVSLIEVMVTLFMIASLLTAIVGLQYNVFTNVIDSSRLARRVYALKTVLFEAGQNVALNKEIKKERTIERPLTTIRYIRKKPKKNSPLSDFKHIFIEQVTAEWQDDEQKETERMIYLLFKPEQKK